MTVQTPSPGRWRRIALPVSVLLNLFLIALIGGHLLRYRGYEALIGPQSLPRILANAQASLSPADAAAFGAVMRRDASRYADSARQLTEARAALERQIMAEPYDAVATRKAFAQWQATGGRFLLDVSDSLIEALGKVSQEGRQKLVASRHRAQPELRVP